MLFINWWIVGGTILALLMIAGVLSVLEELTVFHDGPRGLVFESYPCLWL